MTSIVARSRSIYTPPRHSTRHSPEAHEVLEVLRVGLHRAVLGEVVAHDDPRHHPADVVR
jgi:hypothetical protein